MTTASLNYDISQFEPNIQQIIPIIEDLSPEQRLSLIELIAKIPFVKKEKKSPLDYKYFDVIYMSNDFNDDLGDEFWLGKDA